MQTTTVLEQPLVAGALERSADPRLARAALARILEAEPRLAEELMERPLLRDGLLALACASRSLVNAVVGDPGVLDPLRDESGLRLELSPEGYRVSAAAADVAG